MKEAGGAAGGWTIDIPNSVVLDDAKNGVHDPQTGAKNMTTLVSDPNVVAVIGPLNSSVAKVQIPISNAAGLPSARRPTRTTDLTKGESGARRSARRTRRRSTTSASSPPTTSRARRPRRYILQTPQHEDVYIID